MAENLRRLGQCHKIQMHPAIPIRNEAPPGYVYLISIHMEGAIQSPQTTPEQRKLAISINVGIDGVRRLFEQVQ